MTGLQDVAWAECLLEPCPDAEIEREARQNFGIPYRVVRFYTPCAWLARMLATANRRRGQLLRLDPDLADRIFLAVSQDSSCRYCYAAQRAQLRILGFDEARIRALEDASFAAQADPRERLVLDYVRCISRANPLPTAADREELQQAGYSEDEVREMTWLAASTVSGNRITMIPALPLEVVEGLDFSGVRSVIRPIVARMMRSKFRPGQPEQIPSELQTGPFAFVEGTLDGLPCGASMRRTVDAAWRSEILPRRTKALIYAVIARGLGSDRAEAEARALLEEEGLTADTVDEVLAHLGSPALDPIEAAVVPFARETIRCRPNEIQPRARVLREGLSAAQFLEVVGLVGLANYAGRMSLLLCESR